MAATLFHNVTGSTGVDVELLAPGDGVNNIRSITITNIHDTANATVALRIYRDATAKTFFILGKIKTDAFKVLPICLGFS